MMHYALLTFGLTALLARAQDDGLSRFTVGDWNDISYGQPKVLSWTFGNGRPVSAQLDNDNGPYIFDFQSPYNNNTYCTWIPSFTISPGPHTLVLTQGPVSDTSPPFTIHGVTANTTSTTNSSSVSVLTPTGPAGVGSSTAPSANSSITSSNPGGPMISGSTPTSTVQTTVSPTGTGGMVNETVYSTSYQTNAAGSTTGISSSAIATEINATTSASTLPGTPAATTSASIQTAIAARSSLIGPGGGILGSGIGLLMTVVGGFAFAWLLL